MKRDKGELAEVQVAFASLTLHIDRGIKTQAILPTEQTRRAPLQFLAKALNYFANALRLYPNAEFSKRDPRAVELEWFGAQSIDHPVLTGGERCCRHNSAIHPARPSKIKSTAAHNLSRPPA
jgi:hypothetical protein